MSDVVQFRKPSQQTCPLCEEQVDGFVLIYDMNEKPGWEGCGACWEKVLAANPLANLLFQHWLSLSHEMNQHLDLYMNNQPVRYMAFQKVNAESPPADYELSFEEMQDWPAQFRVGEEWADVEAKAQAARFRELLLNRAGRPPTPAEYWAGAQATLQKKQS